MLKIIFSFLLISNFILPQNLNSNFEFSGVDEFWKIVSKLESNREPSKSDWDKLFNTPGYKVLTSGEFTRQFFMDNFELVFMPSKSKELKIVLNSGKNLYHINHYIKVKQNKELINEQYKKLKSTNYNRDAVSRTLKFLPQSYVNDYPPVSFLIFESNGRGSSPIVVDLAASIEWDFESFLAHEFHHWYRSNQLKYNIYKVSREDQNIVDALAIIEAEGIADMVDKKDWFTKSSNSTSTYARQYINDVGKTPYIIKQMDLLFSEYYTNPQKSSEIGKILQNLLPQRGHTTGYFMASLILEKIGKKELINCVGDPFKFFKTYNEAAQGSNNRYPTFSDVSMKGMNELSNKYSL